MYVVSFRSSYCLWLFGCVALLLLCNACRKSATEATAPPTDTVVVVTPPSQATAASDVSARKALASLQANQAAVKTLTAQGDAQFVGNGIDQSLGVEVRLQRNTALWVSLYTNFGIKIEVARALITPDSVRVLNRFQQQYIAQPSGYVQRLAGYPLGFGQLQALVLGQILQPPTPTDTLRYSQTASGNQQIDYRTQNLLCKLKTDATAQQLLEQTIDDIFADQQLSLQQSDYKPLKNSTLLAAYHRQLQLQNQQQHYKLVWKLAQIVPNTALEMPFVVPPSYTRVP